jgi:hypothetical protein
LSNAENRLANSEYAKRRAGLNLNLLCKSTNPVKMFHVEHLGPVVSRPLLTRAAVEKNVPRGTFLEAAQQEEEHGWKEISDSIPLRTSFRGALKLLVTEIGSKDGAASHLLPV